VFDVPAPASAFRTLAGAVDVAVRGVQRDDVDAAGVVRGGGGERDDPGDVIGGDEGQRGGGVLRGGPGAHGILCLSGGIPPCVAASPFAYQGVAVRPLCM